jgi:hypothetical protein
VRCLYCFTAANAEPSYEDGGLQHGNTQTRKGTVRILLSRPWNDQDVAALRKMWEEGVPVRKLALRFRRSQSAIRGKAVQLGLKRPVQPARPPMAEELRAS